MVFQRHKLLYSLKLCFRTSNFPRLCGQKHSRSHSVVWGTSLKENRKHIPLSR